MSTQDSLDQITDHDLDDDQSIGENAKASNDNGILINDNTESITAMEDEDVYDDKKLDKSISDIEAMQQLQKLESNEMADQLSLARTEGEQNDQQLLDQVSENQKVIQLNS